MKIKPEHYTHLKAKIAPLKDKIVAHRQAIIAEGNAEDIETKLAWDMFYGAGLNIYSCEFLYDYLNDSHIETAIKKIVKEIESAPVYFDYTNEAGQKITVWIEQDCGMVNGKEKPWHKVICRPIGFNNCPPMVLDMATLARVSS